jgi:two-component system, OmpR family, response regulator
MTLTLVQKSEAVRSLTLNLTNAIHAISDSCGMILIACTLNSKQLKALKRQMHQEAAKQQIRFHYDGSSHVLAILIEGAKLSHIHWLGLVVKSYIQTAFGLEKSILVASFFESEYPATQDIEEVVRQLMSLPEGDANLIIYKNLNKLDEKERVVLLIDDDEVAGQFLKIKLESQGYEVHQAYDGVQGVRSCEELSPDVVIMELNLPALDGLQVIRSIQGNDDLDSQIIILSEQRLEKDVDACLELGVTSYITKPYSPQELEAIVSKVMDDKVEDEDTITL